VPNANKLIETAFEELSKRSGFSARPAQRQLALLISDLIESRSSGLFEAPTGLGKSLASLIPAIAHAILFKRRTVIATYTNVLAEQYWRQDLPLSLELFKHLGGESVRSQLLMGRQRYVCNIELGVHVPQHKNSFLDEASVGTETEFRRLIQLPSRQIGAAWARVAAPPVCPGRHCPEFGPCFYYRSRRAAEKAEIVITNHSVVLQDALMTVRETGDGLLGDYDFLILDEAHDFPSAAGNGLEYELSNQKLSSIAGIAKRIDGVLTPVAFEASAVEAWKAIFQRFESDVRDCQNELAGLNLLLQRSGILEAAPATLLDHPHVARNRSLQGLPGAKAVANRVTSSCSHFVESVDEALEAWADTAPDASNRASEVIKNYQAFISEFGAGAQALFEPTGVAVTYSGQVNQDAMLRQDIIGLDEPLKELIWNRHPVACLSATLAIDGTFDFYKRQTGFESKFEEILTSPFNHGTSASLYLPPSGAVPDPAVARQQGSEDVYFRALAREIEAIIRACEGRTLVLFHSRREMEAVFELVKLDGSLPVLIQGRTAAAVVGERFREKNVLSLFGLRSFWTGFDAPGETLSCVVLVRVPFEVPVDPPQIARLAFLQLQGLDPFAEHTLPIAKMMMRQGAGRLIRRISDVGVIAILDPRVKTKRYGEEILNNLPAGMRVFHDIGDAVGFVNLSGHAASLG
jgi:ATP-dependent DNA helicase DinG